ncbi:replication factor C subunit 1 isoform X2 [Nymphaea colorata]|uniref:replication factor C subunit 1 isoform X2 n=1 Tax=Nymphaea colorata TaxID=210225 RepID=UPI00129E4AB4|nr:replication factor C subunit 1 isoform X2 [Nymphaea colorata]
MSDIRKWFMKQHDKGNGALPKSEKPAKDVQSPKPIPVDEPSSGRRKTSKYFASAAGLGAGEKQKPEEDIKPEKNSAKRKAQKSTEVEEEAEDTRTPVGKKIHKGRDDDDEDFVVPSAKKKVVEVTPKKDAKRLKSGSGKAVVSKSVDSDEEEDEKTPSAAPIKPAGRGGGGGRGAGGSAAGRGRGRGGGRGGFMFGERKDPPHKGEKEVPDGAPNCLAGLTFVISGTLDSLEREEAEDLIKRHGGRVTGSVSKKTSYLLADEDIGGVKSSKAKELGVNFLSEDGLFDMIRKSKPPKASPDGNSKRKATDSSQAKPSSVSSPVKVEQKGMPSPGKRLEKVTEKSSSSPGKGKLQTLVKHALPWTEKYRPKVPNDIIGNQSIIKQLHDWLLHWDEQHLHSGHKSKGKKQNDGASKKAVLLSGSPGIGKSTTAKLVSQMLGFEAVEVNASDSRGKADSKITKGIGGSTSNSVKELVNNASLSVNVGRTKKTKSVLIMDEVDGMSAGDRGGVADLIASIKIAKIPIICICNDRYSQKLKSLINYCLPLNFRKPTKQQMAKRLSQVAAAEGLQVDQIALEELGERVNGDMRMALNQLQYMSLSLSVIGYGDVRERLRTSAKDEDISPFTAVDKLFGYGGGKLRMDERIDLSMSDPDLVPLLIQENYINYRPSLGSKDDSGVQRMKLIARAAESIGDGDIINVQIRRYRQWQLSQSGSLASCIIPAALLHGQREILEQGERNFNRFGGWLGKNSTMGKNLRLLDDVHIHFMASRASDADRGTMRLDYFPLLLKRMTDPLRTMPKDAAVQEVVEFMDAYSMSQEDFDTIVELSKFQGHPNPLDGIQPAVKSALTKAYKQGSSSRIVRVADLITLPGQKKAPKKRIAAILEPVEDGVVEEKGDALVEDDEEESPDTEDPESGAKEDGPVELSLQNDKSKGIQVQLDLKNGATTSSEAAASKGSAQKKTARGSGGAKRKR